MLYVSDKAKEKILAFKATKEQGDDFFVRVSVQGGGCSGFQYNFALDEAQQDRSQIIDRLVDFDNIAQPDDQIFEDKGIKLVTDLRSFLYLVDTTLEYSGGLNGKGFYFSNPNAARTCSCGESFSL